MSLYLTRLERESADILARLRRLEEISVPSAAKLLKKPKKFIRANFPIVVHGPKSHHIRAQDIEAYQLRRTVWPAKEFPSLLQSAEDERRRKRNQEQAA